MLLLECPDLSVSLALVFCSCNAALLSCTGAHAASFHRASIHGAKEKREMLQVLVAIRRSTATELSF